MTYWTVCKFAFAAGVVFALAQASQGYWNMLHSFHG